MRKRAPSLWEYMSKCAGDLESVMLLARSQSFNFFSVSWNGKCSYLQVSAAGLLLRHLGIVLYKMSSMFDPKKNEQYVKTSFR